MEECRHRGDGDAALASLKGTSAADLQTAQSALDTAQAQRTAAQSAVDQAQRPTQAAIRQAERELPEAPPT